MNLEISLISGSSATECNEFYNRLHGTARTDDQWRWEFVEGPYPAIFAVVRDAGSIVASQALIPLDLQSEDGTILSAKSEETLIAPDYRGQGLFERMYDVLLEEARSLGIKVIWGFTPATKPFQRIGFVIPAHTSQIVFPLKPRALLAFAADKEIDVPGSELIALVAGAAMTTLAIPARVANAVSRKVRSADRVPTIEDVSIAAELAEMPVRREAATTVSRSAEYLGWRFARNPHKQAQFVVLRGPSGIEAWAAVAIDDDSLAYLVDLAVREGCDPDRALKLLLLEACTYLRLRGVVGMRAWSVSDHPLDEVLRRQATRVGAVRIRRGEPMVVKILDDDFEQLTDSSKWLVSRVFTEGHLG